MFSCFGFKIAPDNSSVTSTRAIELRKFEKSALIDMLMAAETDVVSLKERFQSLKETSESHKNKAYECLCELNDVKRKNKILENGMHALLSESAALKEEMQTFKYEYLAGPSEKSAEHAEFITTIESKMEKMRKCLTNPRGTDLLINPVLMSSGYSMECQTYDWKFVQYVCPVTGATLRSIWDQVFFIKNHKLKEIIELFRELELVVKNVTHPRIRNTACQTSDAL